MSESIIAPATDKATAPRSEDRAWMQSLRNEFDLTVDNLAKDLDVTPTYLSALEAGTLPLSRTMYRRITRAITNRPQPTIDLDCSTPGCMMQGLGHRVSKIDHNRGETVMHKAFESSTDDWTVEVTISSTHGVWAVWTAFETNTDPGTTCEEWAAYSATVTGAFQLAAQLNEEVGL